VKTVDVRCDLCGADEGVHFASGTDYEYQTTLDPFQFVRCRRCDYVYLNPRPDESELDTIYPPTYYSYVQLENRPGKGAISQLRARFHSARLRAAFGDLLRPGEPIRVLDVGCGDGRFLDLMKSAFGDDIETHGIDFEEDAVALAAANGHETQLGRIEDAEYPAEHFHVIYISHVIEHLASPREFVGLANRLLTQGGLLHIETPNVDCAEARLARRSYWGGYHFPRHWHLFTPETLELLGKECGFETRSIEFATSPVFLNWTCHHILWDSGWTRSLSELFSVTSIYRNSLWALARIVGFAAIERVLRMFSKGRGSSLVAQLIKRSPR
jgi:SAM-dependent methyltransferase